MYKTRVSVIVPVYNVELYLEKCLESILQQTQPFDEVIIVNDGSTDSCGDICRKYQGEFPQIVLVEQGNKGLSGARNAGLAIATGDYIVFVDSDDWVEETMCEKIKELAEGCDANLDIIFYASQNVNASSGRQWPHNIFYRDAEITNAIMNGYESLRNFFPKGYITSAVFSAYRKEFLKNKQISFVEGRVFEDFLFLLNAISDAENVFYLPDILYYNRRRPRSIMTSSNFDQKVADIVYIHKRVWEYIKGSERWMADKEFAIKFVLYYAMDILSEVNVPKGFWREKLDYLNAFFKEWLGIIEIGKLGRDELCNLLCLAKCYGRLRDESKPDGIDEDKLFQKYGGLKNFESHIEEILVPEIKIRLAGIPLGESGKKVAIYGIGAHTKSMVSLYHRFIGDIKSEITYIVTDVKDIERDNQIPIISFEEMQDDYDSYILSSRLYQEEMHENLLRKAIPPNKIVALYDKTDTTSFLQVYKAFADSWGEEQFS